MAGMSDVSETNLLKLMFQAVAWANIADNGTSPITIVAWALHTTAGPGEAGGQETNEAGYTDYARETPARTTGGHTVTAHQVFPASDIDFTVGSVADGESVTDFSVGKTISGNTDVWFSGLVTPNITTGDGVTPRLTSASNIAFA